MAPLVGWSALYWQSNPPHATPLRIKASRGLSLAPRGAAAFGEASLAAWCLALLAPSSGAISAWGLWGAPLYLWLMVAPLFIYLGLHPQKPSKPLWVHYPLIPLAHVFATPLPWVPYFLTNRYSGC